MNPETRMMRLSVHFANVECSFCQGFFTYFRPNEDLMKVEFAK